MRFSRYNYFECLALLSPLAYLAFGPPYLKVMGVPMGAPSSHSLRENAFQNPGNGGFRMKKPRLFSNSHPLGHEGCKFSKPWGQRDEVFMILKTPGPGDGEFELS